MLSLWEISWKVESGSKMKKTSNGITGNEKTVRSCLVERGLTCMTSPFLSMLGNITCLKSIAEPKIGQDEESSDSSGRRGGAGRLPQNHDRAEV